MSFLEGIGDFFTSGSSAITTLPEAWMKSGFCAYEVPVPENAFSQPRSIIMAPSSMNRTANMSSGGDLLVLDRDTSTIMLVKDDDLDGILESAYDLVSFPEADDGVGLSHGLAWYDDYLYASSPGQVVRWPYAADSDVTKITEEHEVIITGISEDGNGGAPLGHRTRTIIFDQEGLLYVAIGSNNNIDPDSYRARVRRFHLPEINEDDFPVEFATGEIYADGVRNTVGLGFDRDGVLWGVDAGPDSLIRDDLGGDIHNDNPAEEFNKFKQENIGRHYGYPYCWSEGNLPSNVGSGSGTQFAWPDFMDEYSDNFCRDSENNIPPEATMQSHSSPLGVTFYEWKNELPQDCDAEEAFPQEMDGYAFIAYHGSWNRLIPTGYKVVYFETDEDMNIVSEPKDLLMHNPPGAKWGWGFRPVDVVFDRCGRLFISSDGTSGLGGGTVVQMIAKDTCPEGRLNPTFINTIILLFSYVLDILVNGSITIFSLFPFNV